MSRKENKKINSLSQPQVKMLRDETTKGILAVIFFALALFLILASFGDGGVAGYKTYSILTYLLGIGYFLIPAILIMLAISYLKREDPLFTYRKIIGSLIFLISGLGIIDITFKQGGVVGSFISYPLIKLFDVYVGSIFLSAMVVISILVIFDTHIKWESLFFWKKYFTGKDDVSDDADIKKEVEKVEEKINENKPENIEPGLEEKKKDEKIFGGIFGNGKKNSEEGLEINSVEENFRRFQKEFITPPLSLLEKDKGKPEVGDIKANANIIKRTLQNFGINVEMDEISIGPSVTRYALKPAEGVKLSRIVGLQNDLSLALAAHPLRIEAPIPGKSLVGIEIPNSTKTTVGLATLFSAREYGDSDKPLLLALGKDISGAAHFANLAKAPHMLIAGATGSGKSVTIHTIVNSLLFRNSPEDLKFIMVDPKRVELTLYNGIPHLLTPVITDAKKAILALKWAIKEMERRYNVLEAETVRDIHSYHKNIVSPAFEKFEKKGSEQNDPASLPETMPYIVIIIDELADIMQSYPRELEAAIVRLAQMSRAVGIHLILSTQRPSVNVITGLIKANIPSRIALQVASQIDSRTILDMSGAEKLLGAGDMLYMSGEMSKPKRIQSAFISEKEVKKVTKFITENYANELPNTIDLAVVENEKNLLLDAMTGSDDIGDDDNLYEEAREAVIEAGKASTSYLQRKLRVGYSRAARLIDMLEERGVIGPSDGAKPREVFDGKSAGAENGEIQ